MKMKRETLNNLSKRNYLKESDAIKEMVGFLNISANDSQSIFKKAYAYSEIILNGKPSFIEQLLSAYDLAASEGAALMALAEAFLRIPDARTLMR